MTELERRIARNQEEHLLWGMPDETLTKAMEAAINVGDNGRLLYGHIESCNPSEFGVPEALGLPAGFDRPNYTQYKGTDPWKMSIYHTVLQLTGLDIRTLDRAGGTFYTPDGQDLWSLLQKLDTEDRYGLMDAYRTYRQLAEYGWNSTSDANRTLAWHNGVWTDPSTLRGQHSEEVWHQDLLNQSHARFETYLAGREATLQKEAADRAAGRTSTMHYGGMKMDVSLKTNPGRRAAYLKTRTCTEQAAKEEPAPAVRAQDAVEISPAGREALRETGEAGSAGGESAAEAASFPAFAEAFAAVAKGHLEAVRAWSYDQEMDLLNGGRHLQLNNS